MRRLMRYVLALVGVVALATAGSAQGPAVIPGKLGIAFVVDSGGALDQRVSLMYVFTPGQYSTIFTKTGG